MSSSNPEVLIPLLIVVAIMWIVAAFVYYANPQFSSCRHCNREISIQKQKRYYIKEGGRNYALCKSCYNRHQDRVNNPPVYCDCCGKEVTKRMKLYSWDSHNTIHYRVCATCNRKASKILNVSVTLEEVNQFISEHTSFSTSEELSDALEKLDAADRASFFLENTGFRLYKDMEFELIEQAKYRRIQSAFAKCSTIHK